MTHRCVFSYVELDRTIYVRQQGVFLLQEHKHIPSSPLAVAKVYQGTLSAFHWAVSLVGQC